MPSHGVPEPTFNPPAAYSLPGPVEYALLQRPAISHPPANPPKEPNQGRPRGRPRGRPPTRPPIVRLPSSANPVPTNQTPVPPTNQTPVPMPTSTSQGLPYPTANQPPSGIINHLRPGRINPNFRVMVPSMSPRQQVNLNYQEAVNRPPANPHFATTYQQPQMTAKPQSPAQLNTTVPMASTSRPPCMFCHKLHPNQSCIDMNSVISLRIALDTLRTTTGNDASLHQMRERLTNRLKELTGTGNQSR